VLFHFPRLMIVLVVIRERNCDVVDKMWCG
jgi:hypothetical protein